MPSQFAIITTFGGEFPNNELPSGPVHIGGGPVYPGHPIDPGYGNRPPGGALLPIYPFDPTKPVDPGTPPPDHVSGGPIVPGMKFVVKWLCGQGLIGVPEPKA